MPVAAIAGNLVGYWIGYKAGPAVFNKPDSRLFRQEYVDRSHDFFERYGARTIVLARFVPIVRTFATVMAGASRMRFRTYAIYSVIGGVLWGAGVLALGYYLGHIPFVRNTLEPLIEPILIAVVVLSMVPAAIELLRSRRRRGGMSSAPLRDEPIGPDGTVEDDEPGRSPAAGTASTDPGRGTMRKHDRPAAGRVLAHGHGRRPRARGRAGPGRRRSSSRRWRSRASATWCSPTTPSTPRVTCTPGCVRPGSTCRPARSGPRRWPPRSSSTRSGRRAPRTRSARPG